MRQTAPHITYFRASDGYRFASRIWHTDKPIARIVHVHGIISHGGWYLRLGRYFASHGFEVHFLDRRGSGLNMEARGDVADHHVWLADIEEYLRVQSSSLSTILLGVSWGGKLAAAFARHRPELLAGFGMLCPGLYAKQIPSRVKYAVLSLAGHIGLQSKRTTIPLQDATLFTDSPVWQEYIRRDPFTLRKITIRFAIADRTLTQFATEVPHTIQLPALCVLAGRDRIVDNDRVKGFVRRLGSDSSKLLEYQECAHTLEFEPDPGAYFQDVCRWIEHLVNASN